MWLPSLITAAGHYIVREKWEENYYDKSGRKIQAILMCELNFGGTFEQGSTMCLLLELASSFVLLIIYYL